MPDDIDKFDKRNTAGEQVEGELFSTYRVTPEEAFGLFQYADDELNLERSERNK